MTDDDWNAYFAAHGSERLALRPLPRRSKPPVRVRLGGTRRRPMRWGRIQVRQGHVGQTILGC